MEAIKIYDGTRIGTKIDFQKYQIDVVGKLGMPPAYTLSTNSKTNPLTSISFDKIGYGLVVPERFVLDKTINGVISANDGSTRFVYDFDSERPTLEWFEGKNLCGKILSQAELSEKISFLIPLRELKRINALFKRFQNSVEFNDLPWYLHK